MKNKNNKISINFINALLGSSLLAMLFFNWKNIIISLKIPIFIFSILLIFFYKYIVVFSKKYLSFFNNLFIIFIPTIINYSLFQIFSSNKIKFDNHWFILIFLSGIIPLIYTSTSRLIAYLSYILCLVWFVLAFNIQSFGGSILRLLSILCLCGFIFGIAERISHTKQLKQISQTWKTTSIFFISISLTFLALNIFDNHNYFDIGVYIYNSVYAHGLFLLLFYLMTISILLYNIVWDYVHTKKIQPQGAIIFSTVLLSTLSYLLIDNYFVTTEPLYYTVLYDKVIWFLFNIIFIIFISSNLIFQRKNKLAWIFYSFLLGIFILSKYFVDTISNLKI